MRRLILPLRRTLAHTSHSLALIGMGVLAMAAAPGAGTATDDDLALPAAPPVVAVVEPAGPVMREVGFEAPLRGFPVNSPYGMRRMAGEPAPRVHRGVDFAAPLGTGVFAAAEGTVIRIGHQADGFGHFVEILHPNGMVTLYAHLSRIDVRSGQQLLAGERLGLVGNSGYSTGPHLHLEVRRNGRPIDPARVLGRSFQVVVED